MEAVRKQILKKSFPCIMAKAALRKGLVNYVDLPEKPEQAISLALQHIYKFVEDYRQKPERLSSMILGLQHLSETSFEAGEKFFWEFLRQLREIDGDLWPYDPRVSSNPQDPKFSFSLKSEAFFVLFMHPKSPRIARRFPYPCIVMNPHAQFERLRKIGIFEKVRDLVRKRDKELQENNSMLMDYGLVSEIYQYSGKQYSPLERIEL